LSTYAEVPEGETAPDPSDVVIDYDEAFDPTGEAYGRQRERARTCCEVFVCLFPPFDRIKAATPFEVPEGETAPDPSDVVIDYDEAFDPTGADGATENKRNVPACSPVAETMSSTRAAPSASTASVSAACADSARYILCPAAP
jgi:hypothetical protein